MIDVFDLNQLLEGGLNPGEIHLHESDHMCTHLFVRPNSDGLAGIGPHVHDYCDDVEIVLCGEILIPKTRTTAMAVPSRFIVINPPGTVHGFFTRSENVCVLGIRSPKSYQGWAATSLLAEGPEQNATTPAKPIVVSLADKQRREFKTRNTLIRLHDFSLHPLLGTSGCAERLLIPLGPMELLAPSTGSIWRIPKNGLVVAPGHESFRCDGDPGALVVEVLPLVRYRNAQRLADLNDNKTGSPEE
jgi:hypothetical protein